MHKKDLLRALRSTKSDIAPQADWKQSSRGILVSQISAQTRVDLGSERGNVFMPALRALQFAAKPLAAMVIVVLVGLGSYTASVSATKNSLPGDLFYPVKLTSERVQVNFAKNKEEKAKLEIAFAGRRLQEVQEVKKNPNRKVEDLAVPIQKFKENVIQAKGHLEQVKHENVAVALVLADSLDDQTEEFINVLEEEKKSRDDVNDKELDKEIEDAILATKDTNTAAVTLIIKTQSSDEGEDTTTKEEIKVKVENKFVKTTEKVAVLTEKIAQLKEVQAQQSAAATEDEVIPEASEASAEEGVVTEDVAESHTEESDTVESTTPEEVVIDPLTQAIEAADQAKALLTEARALLEEGKIDQAFEKIAEADRIVFGAENTIDDVLSAAKDEEKEQEVSDEVKESDEEDDTVSDEITEEEVVTEDAVETVEQ